MQAIKYTHQITYKGQSRLCTVDNFQEVSAQLVAELGAGEIPKVEELVAQSVAQPTVTLQPKPIEPTKPGQVDFAGKLRAQGDEHLAIESGFAPKPPVYSIGTRVVQAGVDNAIRMQQDHDSKPLARKLASDLVEMVKAERRKDLPAVRVSDLLMSKAGLLILPGQESEKCPGGRGAGERLPLSPGAFGSLMGRFPCESGLKYLRSCPELLRSINFNHWSNTLRDQEAPASKDHAHTVLRTRQGAAGTEIFASVSPTYTPFDADKIGEALRFAFPDDARGVLDYDGSRVRIEALWRSDVAASEYVAGEIFKAGIIIRSDDSGGGSLRVQSVIWRNLCLNLIILDKAVGVDIRINHVGDVQALARRFKEAFQRALRSVEGFRKAWGYAFEQRDQAFLQRVQGTTSDNLSGLSPEAALPGIFNGILERQLVLVKGRKTDIVPKLVQLHSEDEAREQYGVSRASIVNAFTRYAHQIEDDPFQADEIREGAGRLLSARSGREPSPLPYRALVTAGG